MLGNYRRKGEKGTRVVADARPGSSGNGTGAYGCKVPISTRTNTEHLRALDQYLSLPLGKFEGDEYLDEKGGERRLALSKAVETAP